MDAYSQKQLRLITDIENKFKNGESPSTIVTSVADYQNDKRICLTAVAFVPVSVAQKIIPKHPPIKFKVCRMFELPTSLSVCAFSNDSLGSLANELRLELKKAGIPDNKKYAADDVVLGNITISRFTSEPNEAFRDKVSELKEIEIGSFDVSKISLITTNCVCHPSKTTILGEYNLR